MPHGRGKGRALILLDDDNVRRPMTDKILTGDGYQVRCAANPTDAMEIFDDWEPDAVVVVGKRFCRGETAAMAASAAAVGSMVLVVCDPADRHSRPPQAGCVPLSLEATLDDFLENLDAAISGGLTCRRDCGPAGRPSTLTSKQLTVLGAVAHGYSNRRIAEDAEVTVNAVANTITRIFDVLGIKPDERTNPRVVAAKYYYQQFGVPEEDVG